jgi:hypothetical protein
MYDTYIPLLKRNPGFLQIINFSQQSGTRAVGAESSNMIRVPEVVDPQIHPKIVGMGRANAISGSSAWPFGFP